MPRIELVLGALPALEDALADAIVRARERDPLAPVTVLIGNVLLRPYLRRTLARRGVPQLNVRYLRPHELAQELAAQQGTPRLSAAAERFLVREIAEGAGGYFAGIARRDGFATALRRLFDELELGGFTPVTLGRALGGSASDEAGKHGQLALLYAAYLRRRNGFAAPADDYAGALGARLEGPLFVYGLWSPSLLQARLVEHVADHAPVTVFLPHSGLPADDAHRAFRERLRALGARETALPEDAAAPPLARALFRPGAPPVERGGVALVSAPDTVREVWEAARACLAWARQGIRFHEMAVVYRNRDPYRALVDEIFSEAGIETYLHDGRLLSTHPLGRRVLALLDLAAHHEAFPRGKVMEFLTETELPRATAARHGHVRPSAWETFTREAGVVEGHAQWQERLQRLAEEKREKARNEGYEWLKDAVERIETLRRFIADLHAALAAHPEEATWSEHLAYLRTLAASYAAGVEPIIDALDDLHTLEAVRERVPFDVFCRAVRDDLESRDTSRVLDEPVRLFGRQGVAVIDASSLRHLRFRGVWLLGVAERAWPPPPRPDPLLLEHERRRINEAALGELPLRTEPDDEQLGFWLGAQSAEHLAISYARADAGRSGKHVPSYFFRAVAEACEGRRLTLEDLEWSAHVRRIEAGRLASDDIDASLSPAEYDRGLVRRANEGAESAAVQALAADVERPWFGRAVRARRERWGAALTPYDGLILREDAARAAAEQSVFRRADRSVSASRLETYATCPYRYFLRYTLGLEPVEEPETVERMDHLQRGTLIHEILQAFLSRIGRDDPPRPERRDEHLALLAEIARAAGEDRERRGVTGRPLIWKMDRQDIDEDLVRWYDAEMSDAATSGFLPGAFEVRFGPAMYGLGEEDRALSSDEPLELTVDGRALRLQGRIDRIDWDGARTRFRVIDYKTGKKRAGGVFDRGRALQLPIYLRAAAKLLALDPAQGESQYFYVSSRGGFGRHVVGGDELAERSADLERILATIAGGVDGGYFAPNPNRGQHCQWCDYKDVCDAQITRIMERKAGDPHGDAFRALEEIE